MDAKCVAMLDEMPRPSLVFLLNTVGIPASPTASLLTLRSMAKSMHELGSLDAGEIATEWESLS